jgi:hypothetical protein
MNNETEIVQFLKKEQDRLTKELRGINRTSWVGFVDDYAFDTERA